MTNPPTINAQDVKHALEKLVKKIGRRQRMRAGAFFEMLLKLMEK